MSLHLPAKSTQTQSATHMVAEIVRNAESFAALAEEWNALYRESGMQNLCLTHDWLMTWLKFFPPEQLLVILVRNGEGRLVGAAPFNIKRVKRGLFQRVLRRVQFMGSEPAIYDWMRVLSLPDVDQAAILERVADVLTQEKHAWDVISLRFVSDPVYLETLRGLLSRHFSRMQTVSESAIPYVDLPQAMADYQSLYKKPRKDLQRRIAKLETDYPGKPLEMIYPDPRSEETAEQLEVFRKQHIAYWNARGMRSDFERYPQLLDFYRAALALGENCMVPDIPQLLFSFQRVGNTPVSYSLDFWQGQSLLCHITSYNRDFAPYSPGLAHMEGLIRNCVRAQASRFEFGRGEEEYKLKWTRGTEPLPLWTLRVFRDRRAAWCWDFDEWLKKRLGKA